MGGIHHALSVPDELVPMVLYGLTTCGHSHVFVVDQSKVAGMVRFGLSESGLRCANLAILPAAGP